MPKKITNKPTKEELEKLYIIQNMTTKEIGEIYRVHSGTILHWLKQHNITIKTYTIPSVAELVELYNDKKLTGKEISKIYNVTSSTVYEWLKKYKISTALSIRKIILNKQKLEELYIIQELSTTQIGATYGICKVSILNKLKKYNIALRRCPGIEDIPKKGQSLLENFQEIAKEYDCQKNHNTPDNICYSSKKKSFWICSKNHSYQSIVSNRIKGQNCPYCSGRIPIKGETDLQTTHPILVKEEWDWNKNKILPTDISFGSGRVVWWICKHNHSYKSAICSRTSQQQIGCPYCAGKKVILGETDLQTTHPYLLQEWDFNKNIIQPTEVSFGSGKKVFWICGKCNHSWKAAIATRAKKNNPSGCPKCCESQGEKRIAHFLNKYSVQYIQEHRFTDCRKQLPLPFDFYIPIYGCVEFHGQQHYEVGNGFFGDKQDLKDRKLRDKIKKDYCRDNKIKLIIISYKQIDQIEEILLKKLNLQPIIQPREK